VHEQEVDVTSKGLDVALRVQGAALKENAE
jgi:hypothetical protein